jgi:hypothetical protein
LLEVFLALSACGKSYSYILLEEKMINIRKE